MFSSRVPIVSPVKTLSPLVPPPSPEISPGYMELEADSIKQENQETAKPECSENKSLVIMSTVLEFAVVAMLAVQPSAKEDDQKYLSSALAPVAWRPSRRWQSIDGENDTFPMPAPVKASTSVQGTIPEGHEFTPGCGGNGESAAMVEEEWEMLKEFFVRIREVPVGTLAALDPTADAWSYHQVLVEDLVPIALACPVKNEKELEMLTSFLEKSTLHLQGGEKRIDRSLTPGEGVMPATFKAVRDPYLYKETLVADFGGSAIGTVDSAGFWLIMLLRWYWKWMSNHDHDHDHDHTLVERPADVEKGMRLKLNLCSLVDGFDGTFPTLDCADGCSMIESRMCGQSTIPEALVTFPIVATLRDRTAPPSSRRPPTSSSSSSDLPRIPPVTPTPNPSRDLPRIPPVTPSPPPSPPSSPPPSPPPLPDPVVEEHIFHFTNREEIIERLGDFIFAQEMMGRSGVITSSRGYASCVLFRFQDREFEGDYRIITITLQVGGSFEVILHTEHAILRGNAVALVAGSIVDIRWTTYATDGLDLYN